MNDVRFFLCLDSCMVMKNKQACFRDARLNKFWA